jgi:hypothetical protein
MINAVDMKSTSKFKRGKTTHKEPSKTHFVELKEHKSDKLKLHQNEDINRSTEKRLDLLSMGDQSKFGSHNEHFRKFENNSLQNSNFYDNFHKMLKDENHKSIKHKKKSKQSIKSQPFVPVNEERIISIVDNHENELPEKRESQSKLKKTKTNINNENLNNSIRVKQHQMMSEKNNEPMIASMIPRKEKKKSCCFAFLF